MSWLRSSNRFNYLLTKACSNNSSNLLYRNQAIRSVTSKSTGKKEVVYSDYCKPVAAYSAAIKANGQVFISGQLGVKDGKFVSDDASDQTEQALVNLKGIIEDAGSDLNKVTKTTVLLADINDFSTVNEVYANFFKRSGVTEFPARACYAVANLPLNAKVEIEAFAIE